MAVDKFRSEFAESTAAAFREVYPDQFAEIGETEIFSASFVEKNLEKPKDPRMGRFAFPVFRYARLLKDKPPEIATKVAGATKQTALVSSSAAGGFLNASVDFTTLASETIRTVLSEGANYGSSDLGQNRKYLVEYSSPNVAKPFGIGHLRTTIIGNSLRHIYRKLGYDVVGINYFGDWGTQFGKMIVAFQRWGNASMLEENAIENLYNLYVRYHKEAEENPALDDEAREVFRRLENGDDEIVGLWRDFSDRSIKEFRRVYDLMGIEFDLWLGESDMNEEMARVLPRLEKDGLTSISDGATIVDLDDPHLPPCLLKKVDGATLYATRDIAGMVYRWNKYRFVESLYVVATAQSDHFKQVFKVVELMEEAEKIPAEDRMSGRVRHVDFGWVKFGDSVMSTRRGQIVYLEDVVSRAVSMVREIMLEKNPDLAKLEETAVAVGVGAVLFSQFSVRRQKDVNFNWEAVLSFEGETGPYLQYTHARLCSLLRKSSIKPHAEIDFSVLNREEETRVIELLADFPQIVKDAAHSYEPFIIASYLLRLAATFNTVYQRKAADGRLDKIIVDDNPVITGARISLVKAVQVVVCEALSLLGIKAPEEM